MDCSSWHQMNAGILFMIKRLETPTEFSQLFLLLIAHKKRQDKLGSDFGEHLGEIFANSRLDRAVTYHESCTASVN
ncbi:hypothetical protein RDI58_017916 [Solanum bulbocastanum]|uniref:Uncharacterized protein n=1 Tax=Solanum bulbocastanum TaxID=147425 RepID=A0AAN8TIK5_SOLBU